jgi:hypothetical protein
VLWRVSLNGGGLTAARSAGGAESGWRMETTEIKCLMWGEEVPVPLPSAASPVHPGNSLTICLQDLEWLVLRDAAKVISGEF